MRWQNLKGFVLALVIRRSEPLAFRQWLITLLYTHKRKTTMDSISIRYSLKWQHKTHTHYQWSNCGKLFNVKSGRQVKKVLNGGSIGYWIAGNFITLKELRSQIQSIEKEYCPF